MLPIEAHVSIGSTAPSGIAGQAPIALVRVYSEPPPDEGDLHDLGVPAGMHEPAGSDVSAWVNLARMDSARLSDARARLVRMRWRRAGAWLWPSFVVLTLADAAIGHLLPPSGVSESLAAGALLGLVANLLAVLLLSRPLGNLLRRVRADLPTIVARDYGGTLVVVAVTAAIAIAGVANHSAVESTQRAMQDAITRAQAYIGDRAPDQFRRNLEVVDLLAIQPGTIYRACVPNPAGTRSYCVIVNRALPFQSSVTFSGYEPNSVLGAGAG
jgi:hypothetical protein